MQRKISSRYRLINNFKLWGLSQLYIRNSQKDALSQNVFWTINSIVKPVWNLLVNFGMTIPFWFMLKLASPVCR